MATQSFAIGIPTLNRSDLLNKSLKKYFSDFPNTQIYILDNGNQDIVAREDNFHYLPQEKNLGVAKSWNALCEIIFKNHDFALILNDDIYLGRSEKEVKKTISSQKFDLLRCEQEYHLCSFILSSKCFSKHQFDETFYPAYFEDRDYFYRLKLDGKKIIENKNLNPEIFLNSQTISSEGGDPKINKNFRALANFYIEKWGGLPERETFTTPFNEGSEDYMNFKISYCINHNGSNTNLHSILEYISQRKRLNDEILISIEKSKLKEETELIIKEFNCAYLTNSDLNEIKIKNNLKTNCTGDYIFYLTSTETPANETISNLHEILKSNIDIDLFLVPRINLHPNENNPPKDANELGWSNWPDYQERIFKNKFNLKFSKEKISGVSSGAKLPDTPEYAITRIVD